MVVAGATAMTTGAGATGMTGVAKAGAMTPAAQASWYASTASSMVTAAVRHGDTASAVGATCTPPITPRSSAHGRTRLIGKVQTAGQERAIASKRCLNCLHAHHVINSPATPLTHNLCSPQLATAVTRSFSQTMRRQSVQPYWNELELMPLKS